MANDHKEKKPDIQMNNYPLLLLKIANDHYFAILQYQQQ